MVGWRFCLYIEREDNFKLVDDVASNVFASLGAVHAVFVLGYVDLVDGGYRWKRTKRQAITFNEPPNKATTNLSHTLRNYSIAL